MLRGHIRLYVRLTLIYVSCRVWLSIESDVSFLQLVRSAANAGASWTSTFASFKYFERLSDHRCFGFPRGRFQPASAGLKSSTIFTGRCDGILRRWPYHRRVRSEIWRENSVCCVVYSNFSLLAKSNHLRPSILLRLFVWNTSMVLRAVIMAG